MRRVRKESEENNEVHHLPGRQHGKRVGAPRSDLKNGTRLLAMALATAIVAIRMAFPVNAVVTLSEAAFDPWSYTIVTFGDWQDDPSSSEGEHSTGPMAIGGNWTANTYSFSDARRPGASGMPQLLVEGEASGTVSGIGGDVYVKSFESISGSWDYENGYELVVPESLPVSPTSLRASFTQLSNDIAAYASVPGNAINVSSTPWSTFLVGDDPNLNVFNIELKADMGAVYLNAPTTSQVVINVTNSGVVSNFPQLYLYNSSTNNYAQVSGEPMEIDKRLIWNLSAASEVQSSYNTLHGAILAPTALLKLKGGNSNGTIFVDSYYGSSEFHWSSFEGDLTFVNSTTEPTPTPTPIPTATSTPTPTPVDHIPQATDDAFTVQQDNVLTTGNVLSNDNLGDEPTIVSSFDTTSAQGGTVTHSGNGIFVYTPETSFSGTDTFTYTIEDADGDTSTATVTVTVVAAPIDLIPQATGDSFTVQQDNVLTTENVLSNDNLGDEPTIVSSFDTTSAQGGTVTHSGNGIFVYTPETGFSGTDTFTYTIEDADGDTSTATVTVTVTPNLLPLAVSDTFEAQSGITLTTGTVLANDTMGDADTIILAYDQYSVENGTVWHVGGGVFEYTSDAGFTGTDTFTYTIEDADGDTSTATVTITVVAPIDLIPQATDDSFTVQQDNVLTTENVLSNDNLGDEPTIVRAFDEVSEHNASIQHNGDGTFTYTPETGFSGTDTFTYTIEDADGDTSTATVTVTVTPNLLPLAVSDTFEAQSGITLTTGTVLANDTMGDADTIIIAYDQDSAASGTVWHVGGGVFEYTSDAGFTGTDIFTYTLIDGNGDTSTATVTVTVVAAPIDLIPQATDDSFTVQQDNVLTTGNVLSNDNLGDEPTVMSSFDTTSAQGGTVTHSGNGIFVYIPETGFSGTDTFTYTIEDADGDTSTATVTVTVVAAPIPTPTSTPIPTPIPTPTSTPIPTPTSTPIPTPTSTPTPTPTSTPIPTPTSTPIPTPTSTPTPTPNLLPLAVSDTFEAQSEITLTTGTVLANDTMGDADTIILAYDQYSVENGTVWHVGGGVFEYTSDAGFTGTDTFTYTIEDADGDTSTATVTITVVAPIDLIPQATDDSFTVQQDNVLTTENVLSNDNLGDEPTIVRAFDEVSEHNASIQHNGDGTFTYTPETGFSGTDTFTYTIEDADGDTSTATVTVTVTPNLLPLAVSDTFEAQSGITLTTGTVLANDTMGDADTIIIAYDQDSAASGTVWHVGGGVFEYTSDAGFTGTDIFTYTLIDGNGDTSTATVTVTVVAAPIDLIPQATGDSFTVQQDNVLTTENVLSNDNLGDEPTVMSSFDTTSAQGGTVTHSGNGIFVYIPETGFSGTDTFTYTIEDADGDTSTATVTVTVVAAPIPTPTSTPIPTPTSTPTPTPTSTPIPTPTSTPIPTPTSTPTPTPTSTPIPTPTSTPTPNLLPLAVSDTFEAQSEITLTTGTVLANDTMGDADTIIFAYDQDSVANGTVWHVGGGVFEYTSDAGFTGTDRFTYTLIDGNGDTSTATVTITVVAAPIDLIPQATDDAFTVQQDNVLTTGNVLSNDNLGDEPTVVSSFDTTSAQGGTVTHSGNGIFVYTPETGFSGTDTFTYTIEDADGDTSTATVTVTVTAIDSQVDAVDDQFATQVDVPVSGSLIDNDIILTASALISLDLDGLDGDVVLNTDGTFTFTPNPGFSGITTFRYTVTDANNNQDTATVTITVLGQSPTPIPTPGGVLGATPVPVNYPSINITVVPNKSVVGFGETVEYVMYVTNNGDADLTNVAVTDEVLDIYDYPIGDLSVGSTAVLTVSEVPQLAYVVLPSEAIPVLTVSVAKGTTINGAEEVTSRDDTRVDVINIVITVTSDETTVAPGAPITLIYVVTNEGSIDVTEVDLTDTNIGVVGYPIGGLKVGESVSVTSTVARGSEFISSTSPGVSVTSSPIATGSVSIDGGVTISSQASASIIISTVPSGTELVKTGEALNVYVRILGGLLMVVGAFMTKGATSKKRTTKYKRV